MAEEGQKESLIKYGDIKEISQYDAEKLKEDIQ